MAYTSYRDIQKIYGVDFGTQNISISRIDLDLAPFSDASKTKISYLTDQIGKQTIFNGIQYLNSQPTCDATSLYKKRKMGNECVRSKEVYSIDGGSHITRINMIDGTEIEIPSDISNASIATHIRDLIDMDIKKNMLEADSKYTPLIIFSLPSSLTPKMLSNLRKRIEQIFNLENPMYRLDFLLDSHATAFARFNQAYPSYIDNHDKNLSSSEKVLLLSAGHSYTEVMEISTEYDAFNSVYRIVVVNKTRVEVGARDFLDLIASKIGIEESSKSNEVEKIFHNLSMYNSTTYYGENDTIVFNREDFCNCISKLKPIEDFILESNIDIIEQIGGFCRSFVIQNLLVECSNKKVLTVRRGLSADETTALGASVYGTACILSKRSTLRRVEFTRTDQTNLEIIYSDYDSGIENSSIRFNEVCTELGSEPHSFSMIQRAREHGISLQSLKSPDVRIANISTFSNQIPMIQINYWNLSMILNIDHNQNNKPYYYASIDILFHLNMLDLPEVINITDSMSTYGFDFYEIDGFGKPIDMNINMNMQIELELRYYQKLHDKIGALYNKMEAFYFDHDGYITKKQSILHEINCIINSYAYVQNTIDTLKEAYKRLVDTYEFCRIVTVDPDLLDEEMYKPDSEVVVDHRLTRERVDSILRDERGIEMLENMMNSV